MSLPAADDELAADRIPTQLHRDRLGDDRGDSEQPETAALPTFFAAHGPQCADGGGRMPQRGSASRGWVLGRLGLERALVEAHPPADRDEAGTRPVAAEAPASFTEALVEPARGLLAELPRAQAAEDDGLVQGDTHL
jgi:hypothetical protein